MSRFYKPRYYWNILVVILIALIIVSLYLGSFVNIEIWKLIYLFLTDKLTPKLLETGVMKLGPTYIKLAQTLSNRNDIIPPKYCESLKVLQFNCAEYSQDKQTVLDILKKDSKYFSKIDKTSLEHVATGSIATVYKCKINNHSVIIKTINYNIRERICVDIKTINYIFMLINTFGSRKIRELIAMFDLQEFSKTIMEQTYLTNEVRNMNLCREDFKDNNRVIIPNVYDYTDDYIIESFEEGDFISEYLYKHPDEKSYVAGILLGTITSMVLDHNRIHSDLHEGNFKFRMSCDDETQIILLDFGHVSSACYTTLDKIRKTYYPISLLVDPSQMNLLITSVGTGNVEAFFEDLKELTEDYTIFYDQLLSDTPPEYTMVKYYLKRNIEGLDYGFTNIFNLLRKHKVVLPMHLLILSTNYSNLITILNEYIKDFSEIIFQSYILGIDLEFFKSNQIIESLGFKYLQDGSSIIANIASGSLQRDFEKINNHIFEIDTILLSTVPKLPNLKRSLMNKIFTPIKPKQINSNIIKNVDLNKLL